MRIAAITFAIFVVVIAYFVHFSYFRKMGSVSYRNLNYFSLKKNVKTFILKTAFNYLGKSNPFRSQNYQLFVYCVQCAVCSVHTYILYSSTCFACNHLLSDRIRGSIFMKSAQKLTGTKQKPEQKKKKNQFAFIHRNQIIRFFFFSPQIMSVFLFHKN